VAGLIDPPGSHRTAIDVDLGNAARILSQSPIGAQRLIQQLQQKRAIDAVVADEHHGLARVAFEDKPQRVARSRDKVLQRFALRKPDQVRRCAPQAKPFGIRFLDFVMGAPLPGAVIQVVEVFGDNDADVAAGARDVLGGPAAPLHGTAVDDRGGPVFRLMEQQRQGAITRQLAAWAAILAVPTVIVGIYGMNFEHMPELRWKYGYFLVLGAISLICGLLYRRFKRGKWL